MPHLIGMAMMHLPRHRYIRSERARCQRTRLRACRDLHPRPRSSGCHSLLLRLQISRHRALHLGVFATRGLHNLDHPHRAARLRR